MVKLFTERPVLSTVISIIIVLLGVLGLTNLPITQYPDIAPPTVQVNANYPGANAQTVLESVIIPLEEQINGVEGMTYITSTASNNGSGSIQVFFEPGVDPDIAAVNVQNRVSRANPLLPREVTQSGVIVQKQRSSALMYLSAYSENPEYDATYLQNYLDINVLPALKRINGVGDVNVFGAKTYAMRIWIHPEKLAAYNLIPEDIVAAINEQSREAAAGTLGQNDGQTFEYVLRYSGRYSDAEQFQNIVVRSLGNGNFLYLKDVATVELDALGYSGVSFAHGKYPAVSMGIFQTPGSNANEIINEFHHTLENLSKSFPEGVKYQVNFDTNEFLIASINKVTRTFFEAFILVFLVVFLFLQDFRSTLIPAIAVPVSIIGSFFFLNLFGYSINLLTLFALVLAIGIVVDDAIVVVEAVHAKLEEGAKTALEATHSAMSEITGAIVSITLVMSAVFIPVTFVQGPTGVFYEQFGVTLIIAILISAVNALTLSPALCALLLKPHHHTSTKKGFFNRFFVAFNTSFTAMTQRYTKSLAFLYKNRWITLAFLLLCIGLIFWIENHTPKGFVPNEDRSMIFTNIELPIGSTLDRTVEVGKELSQRVTEIPGVQSVSITTGFSFMSGAGSNYGIGFIKLKPWSERDKSQSADAIIQELFKLNAAIPEARLIFFSPSSVPGFGSSSGFDLKVLDNTGGSFSELSDVTDYYIQELSKRPEIQYAQTSFNTDYPQYEIEVDVPKAKEAGVSVANILGVLQGYIGSIYAADFSKYGKQYRVYVQALPEDRASSESLSSIFVRNAQGEMAPVTQFIDLKRVYGPQSVSRFNLFNASTVSGAPNIGYSSGDAIKAVLETAETALPIGYSVDFAGLTREEISSGSQTLYIFMLSILFVYFFLAAQYESYLIPFAVLFSLPVGVMGAYFTTMIFGIENNIYFQIALIMLVGLLAKNAILIVEFALQRRRAGYSRAQAAFEGAKVRLRPVLMTAFAFIIGLLPLAFATGIGARGNNAIGLGAVGGMFIGTIFGIFVIPILYIFFQWLHDKFSSKKEFENASDGQ